MKDYTRLTDRDDSLCVDCVDIGFCSKTCIMQARYERLQFLENEIESGKIVDRNVYLDYLLAAKNTLELTDKEIEFFAKHNARVRAYVNAEIARLTAERDDYKSRAEAAEQEATVWKDCASKWQKYYKGQTEREIKEVCRK